MKKDECELTKLLKGHLKRFYVVTITSLYEVGAMGEDGRPFARKIALKGESAIEVGATLSDSMLAITPWLQFYDPEEKMMLFSNVAIRRWGMRTSDIVALFRTKKKAQKCFSASDKKPCDIRWREDTTEVVGMIAEDHPTIMVCRTTVMELLKTRAQN